MACIRLLISLGDGTNRVFLPEKTYFQEKRTKLKKKEQPQDIGKNLKKKEQNSRKKGTKLTKHHTLGGAVASPLVATP